MIDLTIHQGCLQIPLESRLLLWKVPPPPLEGTTSCLPAAWFVEVNSFCL